MNGILQEGIYYSGLPANSFAILFLKASESSEARQVGELLTKLWHMYQDLKKGAVRNLSGQNSRNRYGGNLSVLIGFAPSVFALRGARRKEPIDFHTPSRFCAPNPTGGGPIVEGSGIMYANDINENPAMSDQIIIQLIADTELATSRAVVETWNLLDEIQKNDRNIAPLSLTRFYTGFQRHDNRSWLGFHDGVSNMKSTERRYAIAISNNVSVDNWLANGTYLCFMRIAIDLKTWQGIDVKDQELLVGRDKMTGCPLIGVDTGGKPVKDSRCPVRGTFEVIEPGNEIFHEHPPYGNRNYLPKGISDSVLAQSHVGRTRHIEGIPPWKIESSRIYRQGFEFLEPIATPPYFRLGLNFVAFQNSPLRIFKIFSTRGWLGNTNFAGDPNRPIKGMDRLLTVRAAGIYLVPPFESKSEFFPGSSIFL